MFVILNWWYDDTIAEANLVCKDDNSGDTATFETEEAAEKFAHKNLNGRYRIVSE